MATRRIVVKRKKGRHPPRRYQSGTDMDLHLIKDQKRIMEIVAKSPRDWEEIAQATRLPRGAISRALHSLTRSDDPLLNRVSQGKRVIYQLSATGRKMLNVESSTANNTLHANPNLPPSSPPPDLESPSTIILNAMKNGGAKSINELSVLSKTQYHNTVYYIKKLIAKNLVKKVGRGMYDVTDLVQKEPVEPAKPLLTGFAQMPIPTPEMRQWLKMLIREAVIEAGHVLNRQEKSENEPRAVIPQPKLPRVLLVGGLPNQQQIVAKEFEGLIDMKFAKDEHDLGDRIGDVDAIVAWVRFMSHSQDAVLKATDKPYYPVSGGITMVKETLEGIFYDTTKADATKTAA